MSTDIAHCGSACTTDTAGTSALLRRYRVRERLAQRSLEAPLFSGLWGDMAVAAARATRDPPFTAQVSDGFRQA
ncbi:MAG TPA: hypothetical protein VIK01_21035 [Polyangiaceae bacterium]